MKRSIKAIFALMLTALFVFTMIPAASATDDPVVADDNKLIIKNESEDFSFDIYQIATLSSETTGQYDVIATDATVIAAINTAKQSGAEFLAVLDAADASKLGTPANITAKDSGTTTYETTTPGIYYARVKDQPEGDNVSKVKNSVIVWPEYTANGWQFYQTDGAYTVDLGTKVGTDRITKYFAEDSTRTVDGKAAGQDDVINFVLRADVVGSTTDLAVKYEIWDDMCPGLQYVANSAHIYYDEITDAKAADDEFETPEITTINTNDVDYGNGTHFLFKAKEATLSSAESKYYQAKEVLIAYQAKVLNSAKTGELGNPNKDGLVYKLTSGFDGEDVKKPGREVKVYTYAAEATKIDASATAKATDGKNVPLGGAVIGLYEDADCTKLLASGTSDNTTGELTFKATGDSNALRLAPGKYYVKEISAPAGYALSTAVYELTVTDSRSGDGIFKPDGDKVIENFATKLPETGGQGTLMFTLIGAGLILCAGVLFVIIMKKKTTK